MEIISGKAFADGIKARLKESNEERGKSPCLAIMNIGDDKENLLYIGLKENAVKSIGGTTRIVNLPAESSREEVLAQIKLLNEDPGVDGILLQLPVPEKLQLFRDEFLETINPDKDVDGFNPLNRGKLLGGSPRFVSCAALAVMDICHTYVPALAGKKALLVGDSFDMIQPLALLLMAEGCQVLVIEQYYPQALNDVDIAVIDKGRAKIVKGEGIKPGLLLIDAGFYYDADNLYGNVDKDSVAPVEGYHLPVPGGMGPILIAKLLENLCKAAWNQE